MPSRNRGSGKRDGIAACLFVAGFSTVFIALGASATLIGGLLRAYSDVLSTIAGIAIIIMGLHFLGLTRISFAAARKARRDGESRSDCGAPM